MAYTYAIPYEYYEKDKVRRYGFHGTSHKYVSQRAADMLGKPIEQLKLISCHLGNGSSVTAVDGGKSVDTSMGFTPLAGLPMGTRSGDIDAGILEYLMNKYGMDIKGDGQCPQQEVRRHGRQRRQLRLPRSRRGLRAGQ